MTSEISPDLEKSIRNSKFRAQDSASLALARRYAGLLDEAAVGQKYVQGLEALADAVAAFDLHAGPKDQIKVRAMRAGLATITTALGEHSVASDLGPKFLAVLQQLGLTLASRKEPAGGHGGGPLVPGAAAFDEIAARRARR